MKLLQLVKEIQVVIPNRILAIEAEYKPFTKSYRYKVFLTGEVELEKNLSDLLLAFFDRDPKVRQFTSEVSRENKWGRANYSEELNSLLKGKTWKPVS